MIRKIGAASGGIRLRSDDFDTRLQYGRGGTSPLGLVHDCPRHKESKRRRIEVTFGEIHAVLSRSA